MQSMWADAPNPILDDSETMLDEANTLADLVEWDKQRALIEDALMQSVKSRTDRELGCDDMFIKTTGGNKGLIPVLQAVC